MVQHFYPNVTRRYVRVFAIANPSVVCNVRASYSGVETFDNISPTFCTLAILWPPCRILRYRSSQGNSSVAGVKRKRGIATYVTFGYFRGSWASCMFTNTTLYLLILFSTAWAKKTGLFLAVCNSCICWHRIAFYISNCSAFIRSKIGVLYVTIFEYCLRSFSVTILR